MREPSIRGREGIPFWFAHDDFLMLYHKYTIDFPVGGGWTIRLSVLERWCVQIVKGRL